MLGKMPVASGSNHVFQLAEIKWGSMAARFPAIEVIRKSGKECFQGMDGEHTLQDFWAWAFSDLVSNTERGKLAEYIVATAMGCDGGTSPTWGSFDLLSPEGIKIEVKASAYIQSWEQKGFSRIKFSIAESLYWNGFAYAKEKKRQADVYVFCVLKHKEQDTINPIDLEQWEFYPVSTDILNEAVKGQKTICLARVTELCGRGPFTYQMLRKAVVEAWQSGGARRYDKAEVLAVR